jgi:hypothetical protein
MEGSKIGAGDAFPCAVTPYLQAFKMRFNINESSFNAKAFFLRFRKT